VTVVLSLGFAGLRTGELRQGDLSDLLVFAIAAITLPGIALAAAICIKNACLGYIGIQAAIALIKDTSGQIERTLAVQEEETAYRNAITRLLNEEDALVLKKQALLDAPLQETPQGSGHSCFIEIHAQRIADFYP